MGYTRKTERMDIVIEPYRQTILVQQRWMYLWGHDAHWTYDEKKNFHDSADKLIWQQWSGHYVIRIEGGSKFAKQYKQHDFTVNFDIKWVLSNPHWDVMVRKVPRGGFNTSTVWWDTRLVVLDTEDIHPRETLPGFEQYPVVHEFGHAIGNVPQEVNHWDEYRKESPHYSDLYSVMNVGNELRERHLDYLVKELNFMIPETIFSIQKLR